MFEDDVSWVIWLFTRLWEIRSISVVEGCGMTLSEFSLYIRHCTSDIQCTCVPAHAYTRLLSCTFHMQWSLCMLTLCIYVHHIIDLCVYAFLSEDEQQKRLWPLYLSLSLPLPSPPLQCASHLSLGWEITVKDEIAAAPSLHATLSLSLCLVILSALHMLL